jgi:hypothetical protein
MVSHFPPPYPLAKDLENTDQLTACRDSGKEMSISTVEPVQEGLARGPPNG